MVARQFADSLYAGTSTVTGGTSPWRIKSAVSAARRLREYLRRARKLRMLDTK
jgi:hypothetical protein